MDYLEGKFKNRHDDSYKHMSVAYELALDNLQTLFGEKD
jgi:hypothetical protein